MPEQKKWTGWELNPRPQPAFSKLAADRNVIVGIDSPELLKYKVERNAPLPTGELIDMLAE